MSLTGAHDYTGNTVVEEGELHISGNAVKLGTGTLTVKKGAIFSGVTSTGALGNSSYSFNTGSVLQVGASAVATSGKLDFGGKNVTIAKGAIVELGLNSDKTYTTIQNIGKLSMNGTISLHYGTAFEPAVGMEFTLFAEVTTFTGTPVLEDYVVDAEKGLYWDDSDLATKGILRITDQVPVGIRAVERGTQNSDNAPVFDLAGRRVADAFGSVSLRPGIYVVGGKKVRVQ